MYYVCGHVLLLQQPLAREFSFKSKVGVKPEVLQRQSFLDLTFCILFGKDTSMLADVTLKGTE
jgi:hypothetical protein